MGKILRVPVRKSILATATALGASYGKIGSAINIEGMVDLTLHIAESGGSEGAVVRAYIAASGDAPSSSSGLFQLVGANGAESEFTVAASELRSFPLYNLSGKYLLLYAKGSSSTTAQITAFVTGNLPAVNGQVIRPLASTVLSATALTSTSYADKGSAVNIEGMSDLTLHLTESGTTEGAKVKVFIAHTGSAPTATTSLQAVSAEAGTSLEFTVLKGEKASHPLRGITGKYLMIQAADTTGGSGHATLAVTISGNVTNL
jgi:hypothetical protein